MAAAVSAYLTFTRRAGVGRPRPRMRSSRRRRGTDRAAATGREHVGNGGELVAGTVAGAAAGDLGGVDGMPSGLRRRRTCVDS